MKWIRVCASVLILIAAFPLAAECQIFSEQLSSFQQVLDKMYNKMILSAQSLIAISQAIAAFGALWYIGVRVLKHWAATEPIDFFPLFRPLIITMLITIYPSVLGIMNGIMSPTVIATREMVVDANDPVAVLLEKRQETIKDSKEWQDLAGGLHGEKQDWQKYEQQEEPEGLTLGSALTFSLSIVTNTLNVICKLFFSFLLQILYFAAALCIDAIRTFILLILSILGPFVLCLSVYDGFQHILPIWIARYVNIYLWLPIANLLGAMLGNIQNEMIRMDLEAMQQGQLTGFGQTDIAYLIFLAIGIVGYFCVPSIANYVVHAAGSNAIVSKTNSMVLTAGSMVAGGAGAGAGAAGTSASIAGAGSMASSTRGSDFYSSSMADASNAEPYNKEGGNYNYNKISGNA